MKGSEWFWKLWVTLSIGVEEYFSLCNFDAVKY